MDFHAITDRGADHVLSTHRNEADNSPLQLVSAAKVAYWQRIEIEHAAFMEMRDEGVITPENYTDKKIAGG